VLGNLNCKKDKSMANRRMFAKSITNSSAFLMMPLTTQALYFHLGMNADDDGFAEHFSVMKLCSAGADDLKLLNAKGFVKVFDDMVLIINDWHENNYIQSDRYTPSKYLDVYSLDTQVRLGKVSKELVKDTITYKKKYNTSILEAKKEIEKGQDEIDVDSIDWKEKC